MFSAKGLKWLTFIFTSTLIILILICSFSIPTAAENVSIAYEVPIYQIPVSESTRRDIWNLCEENRLSYELVLAIFHTEGIHYEQLDAIKPEVEKIVYLRDYWTKQGFPDEIVFELMLLSRQRGIEGCLGYMKDNKSYNLDDYVQKVTNYKYYLEKTELEKPNMTTEG